jgi:hypothetical protein
VRKKLVFTLRHGGRADCRGGLYGSAELRIGRNGPGSGSGWNA